MVMNNVCGKLFQNISNYLANSKIFAKFKKTKLKVCGIFKN